jgi:hypothetical protein
MLATRLIAFSLLALPTAVAAYQADLVPATRRIDGREIEGSVSITGADGTIRVRVEGVNDARGSLLDSDKVSVHVRVRVNGVRRRVTIPLTVESGDGEASASLGLQADDKVIVQDVRVRGPDHRTLAQAGVVTADLSAPPPPEPPPPPSECPAALESCQSDLADCNDELATCEAL